MTSPAEREKALIAELISFVPYGPTSAEMFADKVDLECTQGDDHDLENCQKCYRMRRAIVIAIRSALSQQVSEIRKVLNAAKVAGAVGLDGVSPAWLLGKAVPTLNEVYRQVCWMEM